MQRYPLIAAVLVSTQIPMARSQESDPFAKLRTGIQTRSDSPMIEFFQSWYQASEPLRKQPVTDLQREAEAVMEAMLDPANFHMLMWGWSPDSIKAPTFPPYIVPEPMVKIFIDSSIYKPVDSLCNMFPSTLFGAKTLVYNTTYHDSIEKWLRRLEFSDNRSIRRFFSKFVSMACHEGGCTIIEEPTFSSILFSLDKRTALIRFWADEAGGNATLSKINGKWEITKREITSME